VANFGSTDLDQQNNIQDAVYNGAPYGWIAAYSNANHQASTNKGQVVTIATVTDGTSNTLLNSELIINSNNSELRGLTWWADSTGFTALLAPNSALPDIMYSTNACNKNPTGKPTPCDIDTDGPLYLAARSLHSGGVNAAMCDGSVRFFKNSISLPIWRALASTKGGEILSADSY